MFKYLLFPALLFIPSGLEAQGPTWSWAMGAGGNNMAQGTKVAVDGIGNVYQTGWYSCSTITLQDTTLVNTGPSGTDRIFLAKYTSQGELLWVRQPVYYSNGRGEALAIDDSGDVILGGSFKGNTIKFDTIIRSGSSTNSNIFIAKYDSAGNALWVTVANDGAVGSGADFVRDVCVDDYQNILVTGGSSSASLTFGTFTLTNPATSMSYVAKLNNMGTVLWARGTQSACVHSCSSVTVDPVGNVYVGGWYYGIPMSFGGGVATSTSAAVDGFIFRFGPGGQPHWVHTVTGSSDEELQDLRADDTGKLYAIGSSKSWSVDFGSGPQSNPGAYYRGFIAQFDTTANPIWVELLSDSVQVFDMAFDGSGNTHITGVFSGHYLLAGNDTLFNTGNTNAYVMAHDPAGNPLWTAQIGGGEVYTTGIGTDGADGVYLSGYFNFGDAHCDTLTLAQAVPGQYKNIFLGRLQAPIVSTAVPSGLDASIGFYPNPTTSTIQFTDTPSGSAPFTIHDVDGREVMKGTLQGNHVDVRLLPNGVYILQLYGPQDRAWFRFVKQ